ncbi:MAG: type IX secretion system protein PorQ [Prevotellaceae bacterium]|jgi:hypothetical protein|nr:type IX secretion system protein PorQ [Prevotellaceae bacterium]
MYKKLQIIFLLLPVSVSVFSQAGYGIYQFLDLPVSSRMAALGGFNISLYDNDLNFAFMNPALLSDGTSQVIGINAANYLADVQFGTAVYGQTFGKKNHMAFGVQYIDYGKFKEVTELNEHLGEFTAKDFALNIIYARPLTEHLSVGGTLKPIYSVFERYSSFGIAIDAGMNYNNPEALFSAGLVFRNMGRQLKGYYSEEGEQHIEPLAFNIMLGATQKLRYAPLRFSFTLHNLQQWDLSYQTSREPTRSLITNAENARSNKIGFIDMFFRHSIIGVEFIPGKNFYLAAGYHHRRRQEMAMEGFKSMAGFSFGGGIKLYKFQVGFGMTQFQTGNYSYQFSISTSLNEFRL